MFGRLSGWVFGPVIIGALVGQWLDSKYGKEPWLFLASVGIAFMISMIGLVRNTMEEYRKVERMKDDQDKKGDKSK
jgi:F0F1-type ATP synthase assembly protein I